MSDGLPAETKKLLRSLLISAEHGVALKDLTKDFYDTVGYQLPYKRLGYNNVEDMLCDIPDTVRVSRDCAGQIRLFGVANQDTAHIADMIKKQKKGSFNPYKAPPKAQGIQVQRGRRGGVKPNYNSRYNNSFNGPRPSRVSSQFARSQTLPPSSKFEYDNFSSSSYSYSSNRYQQGYSNYRGGGGPPSYGRPPQSYSSGPFPTPPSTPSYTSSYDRSSTQSYNYQDKPHKHPTSLHHGRSAPVSETLSPNKNSHLLHGTKEAIHDLLSFTPNGIPGGLLEDEYYKVYREKLPYYYLGYRNSKEFIESIPDIVKIEKIAGGPTMCYLADSRSRVIKENARWPDHKSITLESFSPLDDKGKQVTPHANNGVTDDDGIEDESIILTEEEKKRHLNELKSNVYKFLYNEGKSVPLDEFEDQYRAINREDPEIAYRLLGYATLKDFLSSILDIVILLQDNLKGSWSVILKSHSASPPSPNIPPRYPVHLSNPIRSRMPPSNLVRPYTAHVYPPYKSPYPASGFVPPGPPVHQMHPQRLPPPSSNPRYPMPPSQALLIPPLPISEPFRPTNNRDPPGFDDPLFPPNGPPSLISPTERMTSDFVSSLSIDETPFTRPHGIATAKINSLSMDFDKARHEFIRTIIVNITEVRKEIRLKVSSSLALRFLTGYNVAVLAAENQGKCVCMAISLALGLDMLVDNLQSLVVCNDSSGVEKMFECLKISSYNTGVKVSSYPSADNFIRFEPVSHVIIIVYPLLERLLNTHDISQLTRIGVYNLIIPPVQFNKVIHSFKQLQSVKPPSEVKYFFATNPHYEAGSFILKMVNVLMRSKCSFTYYGNIQESELTLIPHETETETKQVLSYTEAHLRLNLLASVTRWSPSPNRFDKYLIPLAASGYNFTILSDLMEERLLQSLALLALIKVEPSLQVPQVVVVVPNEQIAKDLLELSTDMGRLDGTISCIITDTTNREDTRYTEICIGCPHEIATFSKNTFSFTKISLVIVFKIDMELNMSHLADLFQNCQSPQVIVVGASYTRQILNLESKYMSEPRHITFLAEEIY